MNKILASVAVGALMAIAAPGVATVRRLIPNRSGTDKVTASAKNTATGETCSATAPL